MRSPRRLLIEEIRQLLEPDTRLVDTALQARVYRRGSKGRAEPAELRETIYGGKYDRVLKQYIAQADNVQEISCHPGQLRIIEHTAPGKARVLILGPPGSGKSEAIVIKILLQALERPNTIWGLVAPTGPRIRVLWRKMLQFIKPRGLLKSVHKADREIHLVNGSAVEFVSAKEASEAQGNQAQGRDWDGAGEDEQQNIADEMCREVDSRGRNNPDYTVWSTATNMPIPHFQARLQGYQRNELCEVLKMDKEDNVFTAAGHYDRIRKLWSADDYRRMILMEDVALPTAVYPQYSSDENVRPLPSLGVDITAQIVHEMFPGVAHPAQYIVGTDFGQLVSASVVFKAFAGQRGERLWWAVDEITTRSRSTDFHAAAIAKKYPPNQVVVIGDRSGRAQRGTDKSDFTIFKNAGFTVFPAFHTTIKRRHRFTMVNALLHSADGNRRLFLAADDRGRIACGDLAKSFLQYQYGADGNPQQFRKGTRDLSHWTDALGYALFRWERIHGAEREIKQLGSECDRCGHSQKRHTLMGCGEDGCACGGMLIMGVRS